MYKQNIIIFTYLLVFISLSACGLKGPLYQTPEKPKAEQQDAQDQPEKSAQANSLTKR
jgi:predicted small lipoprotein YifL